MSNVIKFSTEDWVLMQCMRNSVNIMKATDPVKYRLNIKGDQAVYEKVLREAVAA